MHETTTMRHGLEDTSIRNLVAEEESNVLITYQPFTGKLLVKGIQWDSTIEASIQAVFGVLPEQGRVVLGDPWSAMSWGTNEYLMTNSDTSAVQEFSDINQPLEENQTNSKKTQQNSTESNGPTFVGVVVSASCDRPDDLGRGILSS